MLMIEFIPSPMSSQYSPHMSGTTSQKISLKAQPIPTIMRMGKKMIPRTKHPPSSSESSSKENPKSPATMQTRVMPMMTSRSLKQKMKSISARNRIISSSLSGALKMQARVSPQHSLQHWQSQHGSSLQTQGAGAAALATTISLPFSSWFPQWACSQTAPQTQQNWYPQRQVMWLQPWFFSITNLHLAHCLQCRLLSKKSTSCLSQSPSCRASRHFAQNDDSHLSHTITFSKVVRMKPSQFYLGQSLRLGSLAVAENCWKRRQLRWTSAGSCLKNSVLVSRMAGQSSRGQRTSSKILTLQMTQWWRQDSQKLNLCSQLHMKRPSFLMTLSQISQFFMFRMSFSLLLSTLPSLDFFMSTYAGSFALPSTRSPLKVCCINRGILVRLAKRVDRPYSEWPAGFSMTVSLG